MAAIPPTALTIGLVTIPANVKVTPNAVIKGHGVDCGISLR